MTNYAHYEEPALGTLAKILIALVQDRHEREILWRSLRRSHPYVGAGASAVVLLISLFFPLVLLFPRGSNVIEQAISHVTQIQLSVTQNPQDPFIGLVRVVEMLFGPYAYVITGLLLMISCAGFVFGGLGGKQLATGTLVHATIIYGATIPLAIVGVE